MNKKIFSVTAGNRVFETALLVFDKDGLLFSAQQFWKVLADMRNREFRKFMKEETIRKINRICGVTLSETGEAFATDPSGILALVSQPQEEAICAAVFMETEQISWTDAVSLIRPAFQRANDALDYPASLTPNPGFPDIFFRAQKTGIPIAIATQDTCARTLSALRKYGAENTVSRIVSPETVRAAKPAPDMLLFLADQFGVQPAELLMIGDSFTDTEMAKNAGAKSIGIPQDDRMKEMMKQSADVIVGSLEDIRFTSP